MHDVRAVVFDLDDTLIDWQTTERLAIDAVCSGHLSACAPEEVHAVYGAVKRENFEAFLAHGRWSYVGERLEELLRRLGRPEDPQPLVHTFSERVRQELRLLPGTDALLDQARNGRKTALLTNGPASVQRPKVDGLGLQGRFDHVAVAGEIGLWKPDVRAFEAVLERLGTSAEETLMVGDSLHFDIRPARALGMRTCWIGGSDPREADLVLPKAADLARHLVAAPVAKSS